jgi:20S proteasome subunit beta 5
MNAVLSQLQPQSHYDRDENEHESTSRDAAAWGSMGGFGNLAAGGGIGGMMVPRVSDVSVGM